MMKSSYELKQSLLYKSIKDKIKSNSQSIQISKSEKPDHKIIPIISLKRRQKDKYKALFSHSPEKQLLQPSSTALKQPQISVQKSSYDEEQQKNVYLLQVLKNQSYLRKKKSMQKEIKNQGISICNHSKKDWIVQSQNQQTQANGLNNFTNIVIRSLQKKCKKASFSKFLEDKKQQDFRKKFKYDSSKRFLNKQYGKNQFVNSEDKIKFKQILNKSKLNQLSPQNLNKHSRSVILAQSRKKYVNNRVYSKVYQRYNPRQSSIQGLCVRSSLQISQIKANQ